MLSTPSSHHPLADEVYLAITSLYFFAALQLSTEPQLQQLRATLEKLKSSREQRSPSWDILITLFSVLLTSTSNPLSASKWKECLQPLSNLKFSERTTHLLNSVLNVLSFQYSASPRVKPFFDYMARLMRRFGFDSLMQSLGDIGGEEYTIMMLAIVQCPLHGYMLFTLRASNDSYLSGDSQNQWGFGQIVPLVLLVSVATECIKTIVGEYPVYVTDL